MTVFTDSGIDWSVVVAATGVLALVIDGVVRVLSVGVVPGNRKPSTGMAWILLIMFIPVAGLVIFWLFGRVDVGRRRHLRQIEARKRVREQVGAFPHVSPPSDSSPLMPAVVRLNDNLGALPLVADNDVLVIEQYEDVIAQMTAEVAKAERTVHAEFYIAAWDELTGPLFEAMAQAAERGVDVRLLFDHIGSRRLAGYRDFTRRLDATRIRWYPMLPIMPLRGRFRRPDLRNHRKLLVVDGAVGFTGSLNLTERGYHKASNHRLGRQWVECMVRLRGHAVSALDTVFATDWYSETSEVLDVEVAPPVRVGEEAEVRGVTCQIVPSGPGVRAENNLALFTTLMYSATRRISLTSPYFVPDESLLYAVKAAAQRGVDVELFVSEQSDQFMVGHAQASYYRTLLEVGVRIYLYPAPYILHSKHFTVDEDIAVIGSSNMDMRSFALNFEISVMMLGEPITTRMRAVEDHYREISRELLLEEWLARPRHLKYLDNAMRLTSALQ